MSTFRQPYRRRELVQWCRPGGHIVAITDIARFVATAGPTLLAQWVRQTEHNRRSCTGCQTWLARQKPDR